MSIVVTSGEETIYESVTKDEGIQQLIQILMGEELFKEYIIYLWSKDSVVANAAAELSTGSTVIDDDTIILTAVMFPGEDMDVDAIYMRMEGESDNFSEAVISGSPLHLIGGSAVTVTEKICLYPYDADFVAEEVI